MNSALQIPAPVGQQPVRILLADDHSIFRQCLCMLLEREGFEVVGQASGGQEAVGLAQSLHPDVVILDYSMPDMNGIDTARAMQKAVPGAQTILLTAQEDNANAIEALRAGMHGYIYKSQTAEELVGTVREVAGGAIHFSARLPPMAIESYITHMGRESDPLTERERQVLRMIATGNTTRAIAKELGLSAKTVESHRSRIMHKLHLHRAAELIRYAIRRQLITP
ncbi:MAG: response regulator [Bacillota bacterium]